MNAPQSPLAVLDAEIARYEASAEIDSLTGSDAAASDLRSRVQPLHEARAAVAALVEADREYDIALAALNAATLRGPSLTNAYVQAKARRAAALAAFGGAP